MSASGKHGRSAKKRGRPPVRWHRLAVAALLAGAAGCLSYAYFPSAAAAPLADRLNPRAFSAPALANLLGQGQGSPYASPSTPTPIATATAKGPVAPKPRPTSSAKPTASPTSPSDPARPLSVDAVGLGLYDGNSSPGGIETAANWLGSLSSVKYAEDFIDATDFSHIANPWQLSNWEGSPFTMVWGVPMVPCGAPSTQCATNVSDFNEVADGGADSYYKTLAQNLVSAGFGSSYIRLGWEFNGTWMGWSVCNQEGSGLTSWASDFVPAFQNIVTSMRSVSGANFKFIWNPIDSSNVSCAGVNLEQFYPGDSYVDMVALDVYDGIGQATSSDAARWSDLLNGVNAGGWTAVTPAAINGQSFEGYGLNWLAAFGKEHSKEIGLPEWGLDTSGQDAGGGDDSYFVTQMSNWIKTNATGPAIFWNSGGGTLTLNIPDYTSDDTPDATEAFKAAFGLGI
jgi:Glycosyl hydrolase family 26